MSSTRNVSPGKIFRSKRTLARRLVAAFLVTLDTLLSRIAGVRSHTFAPTRIMVDASYRKKDGKAGIGVYIPSLGVAYALEIHAFTSFEAEALAVAAGVAVAKERGIKHFVIVSDCKWLVDQAYEILRAARGSLSPRAVFARLSSTSPSEVFVARTLARSGGAISWQPRENNGAADRASNIASRVGTLMVEIPKNAEAEIHLDAVLQEALGSLRLSPAYLTTSVEKGPEARRSGRAVRRFTAEMRVVLRAIHSAERTAVRMGASDYVKEKGTL